MYIDPIIIQYILIAGASVCTFMIGLLWSDNKREAIIESTIMYLVENNYVKAKHIDGEIELLPLDEVDNS